MLKRKFEKKMRNLYNFEEEEIKNKDIYNKVIKRLNEKRKKESIELKSLKEKFNDYSEKDLYEKIKKEKYELIFNSETENIMLFYKIIQKKLHLFLFKKESLYFSRKENRQNFYLKNYIIDIEDIKEMNVFNDRIEIINNKEKYTSIYCFHQYSDYIKEEMTNEEKEQITEDKKQLKLNIQMLMFEILKSTNINLKTQI